MELYSFCKDVKLFTCVGRFRVSSHASETVGDCRFTIDDLGTGKAILWQLRKMDNKEHFLRQELREFLDYRVSVWDETSTKQAYVEAANFFLQATEHLNVLMANAPAAERETPAAVRGTVGAPGTEKKGRAAKGNGKKPAVIYIGSARVNLST